MIKTRKLTKYYGPRPAVQDLDIHVQAGSVTGFLGVNGAGKTTTMRLLACYLYPTAGTASISGYDILENPLAVRKLIGYMPENPPLYNEMTVRSFLRFAGGLRGLPQKQIRHRVDAVVEQCGLQSVYNRIINRLSKGYRQRVGLAQALVHDPPVLILDEPTVGLDPRQVLEIRHLVQELKKKHTILLSSHILYEITQVCDDVIVIHEGRTVAQGSLEELQAGLLAETQIHTRFLHPPDDIVEAIEEHDNIQKVEPLESGNQFRLTLTPGEDHQAAVIEWLASQSWGLLEARIETLTLEDIFLRLTTGQVPELPEKEDAA